MNRSNFIFFLLVMIVIACGRTNVPSNPQPSDLSGEDLSKKYCGSCHLYPEPSLLDKASWMGELLPNMGCRLGITTQGYDPLKKLSAMDQANILGAGVYPEKPLLAFEDWQKILRFYESNAPDTLALPIATRPIGTSLPGFRVRLQEGGTALPATTLTQIDEANGRIYIGTSRGSLLILNSKTHRKVDSFALYMPPVSVVAKSKDTLDLLCIGLLKPNEQALGMFGHLALKAPPHSEFERIEGLKRPVWLEEANLIPGGIAELVICEYGYQTGCLAWFEKTMQGWKKHELSTVAGAIKTAVQDIDGDGRLDVIALLAQGNEQITVWYNRGNAPWEQKTLLQFPSVYGSADFRMIDFDGDGDQDIVYANGDNDDFSPIAKPYHGIRIFLNDGKGAFLLKKFYPMQGAFQVHAADFNQDGRMDIVASAFFSMNVARPECQFVYLQQQPDGRFDTFSFPQATAGRWLTMDTGDTDGDGDEDIIIGSFLGYESPNSTRMPYLNQHLSYIFLENKLR